MKNLNMRKKDILVNKIINITIVATKYIIVIVPSLKENVSHLISSSFTSYSSKLKLLLSTFITL